MPLSSHSGLYRIGAVSKATGIPVSTLRIWETRYGAFQPIKTAGKQRLYQEQDVAKAQLFKQLSSQGHAISAIAKLDLAQLRHLRHAQTPEPHDQPREVALTVVGAGLANRIEHSRFTAALQDLRVHVSQVLEDMTAASQVARIASAQVLLVKVNSLHPDVHRTLQELVQRHGFTQTIVVYHFASQAVVQALTFAGFTLRREPVTDNELAELLRSVLLVDTQRAPAFDTTGGVIPARKYSDATLSRVAATPNRVLCECPRHVAELIAQLASFEDYSQGCLQENAADAHLHAYLRSISGTARALFETALEKIAQHEGIDLQEEKNSA